MENDAFVRSVEQATLKMVLKLKSNVDKACLVIESEAKKNCPVDQGPLRASITSEVSLSTSSIEGSVGSNLDYAPYVHEGTGIYAQGGNGRKTPWIYVKKGGKNSGKGFRTVGQKPQRFLETAKLNKKGTVEKILGED